MPQIKILIEGYANEVDGVEYASSSVTLIQTNNLNILVDTGMNRELLLSALQKENLTPSDINFVVLTHMHPDHCLLAGIFENAQILNNSSIHSFDGEIIDHEGKIPDTDIEIISTTGHDEFHCSVSIDTAEYGKVVIAGDVFWWPDSAEQIIDRESLSNLEDEYMQDADALRSSRENILAIANYIIPGHGKPFKFNK